MASPYHTGELAVQARAGVLSPAMRLGGMIRPEIPPQARTFLADQQFVIVGAAERGGQVWASMLAGDRGMLRVLDPHTLHIAALPAADDPLAETLADARAADPPTNAGVLVIDLATRRRLRVNGVAEPAVEGGILLRVREAYWICPKYIQRRIAQPRRDRPSAPAPEGAPVRRAASLTDAQRGWVTRADTFFIASAHPVAGADASHRGGTPGFVRLERGASGEDMLVFPDYPGNNMFNTFGNLAVNPAAGLLFVDFERGATLHLTGAASVLWEAEQYATFPGAERAVRFRVDQVLELPHATPLRWFLVERSPFNPLAVREALA